jgi:mlo protein
MKQSIFDDQTSKALKNWRAGVKKKNPNSKHGGPGSPSAAGGSPTAADGGIALTQGKPGDEDGTGLQAGAAGDSGNKAAEEFEFVKIDD